jgi:predicted AAA+ superfamily ATPase
VEDLDAERFFSEYLATYLERDVRSSLGVRSARAFDRFMRLCAARSGQLVSCTAVATDLGVSPDTVKSRLSVIEASKIVQLLEPFYENLGGPVRAHRVQVSRVARRDPTLLRGPRDSGRPRVHHLADERYAGSHQPASF